MDNFIFEIKNQIYETIVLCQAFFKKVNWPVILVILLGLIILCFRHWQFKRIFSLFFSVFILIIAYVRIEALFVASFSSDAVPLSLNILNIVSVFLLGAIFLYHAFIVQ